jgi:hypothetical protein
MISLTKTTRTIMASMVVLSQWSRSRTPAHAMDHLALYTGTSARDRVAVLLRLLGGERRILLYRSEVDV